MRKLTIAALAFLAVARLAFAAGPIPPVGCPNCILNTPDPQNAQVNIGTATIRGTLTVSTISVTNMTIGTLHATTLTGIGSAITALNANELTIGTAPAGRLIGSYPGITGLGTLTAGTWHSTAIGTQYGGTGKNLVAVSTGSLIYFDNLGSVSTLAAGTTNKLLQTNGLAAPSWTAAPTITGTNISAIPPANLAAGNLPQNVAINNASISTVAASKIIGDIDGNAENINGDLALNQLSAGTLPIDVVASSITVTGVVPGTFGNAADKTSGYTVGTDGRLTYSTHTMIAIATTQIKAGTLPANVLVPAASIQSGVLGASVRASSFPVTGVIAGIYGGPTVASQLTINAQGLVTNALQFSIPGVSTRTAYIDLENNWHHAQTSQSSWTIKADLSANTITANTGFSGNGASLTSLTASAISAGSLGSSVIASSAAVGSIGTEQLAALAVTTAKINTGAVDTTKLAAGAVDTNRLNANAVTTVKLAPGAVDTTKLAAGAVDTNRLNADAVTTPKILDSAVTTAKVASGAIDTTKLAAGAVDTNRLNSDAVTTSKILDSNVTNAKLASAAVDTTKIASGAVGQSQLQNSAVNTANLMSAAVDTTKILAGAVDTNRINTDAVTTVKILDLNVTTGKIAAAAVDTTKLGSGAVGTSQLQASAVTTNNIAAGAVDTTKIAAGAVDTNRLNADAVTTAKILDANVTTQKIAANAIDTTKLGSGAVGTSQLQASAVTTNNLASAAVDTTKLAAGAVDTNRLNSDAVTSAKILDGAVTVGKIGTGAVDTTKILAGAVDTNRIAPNAVDTSKMYAGGAHVGDLLTVLAGLKLGWAAPAAVTALVSSGTVVANGTTTQSAFNIAYSTITPPSAWSGTHDVICWLNISMKTSVAANVIRWSILLGGQYVAPMTSTIGALQESVQGAGSYLDYSGHARIPAALLSGTTPIALTIDTDPGETVTWSNATSATSGTPSFHCAEQP